MAKKMIVLDFLKEVSAASDDIPVTVKHGLDVVCKAKSLRWLLAHGMPYELEAKIREIVICRDNIVICIQPKDYISKL